MVRRVAITLAGITAAAFMAAGPAAACNSGHHAGFAAKKAAAGSFTYENLGGPYGITRAHGRFAESAGVLAVRY
jgi:hypothetical protein